MGDHEVGTKVECDTLSVDEELVAAGHLLSDDGEPEVLEKGPRATFSLGSAKTRSRKTSCGEARSSRQTKRLHDEGQAKEPNEGECPKGERKKVHRKRESGERKRRDKFSGTILEVRVLGPHGRVVRHDEPG